MTRQTWLAAADAAARLGVSRTTLYAYVSRGYVRSQATPGAIRERGYSRDDVERLRQRTEERRNPDKAAARALQWGMPVLESAITLIDGKSLYYRGRDALALARERSIAEVAALIWTGRVDAPLPSVPLSRASTRASTDRDVPFVAKAQSILAAASAADAPTFDLLNGVVPCGWRILHLLTETATGSNIRTGTIDAALARSWGAAADVLRAAVILCADHELNVSSFTARCVASAGSSPYAVVIAGLAALEGVRHGGASARVESMLGAIRRTPDPRRALTDRLRRGEPIGGFGHPLYPSGDPRATMLLDLLQRRYARSREVAFVSAVVEAAAETTREKPNLDFALAAVARVLRLPAGAPLMLFAIGRTIGWIGHAIEQYAAGQLIRPRAKHVGVVPLAAG